MRALHPSRPLVAAGLALLLAGSAVLSSDSRAQEAPLAAPTGIVRITSPVPGASVYVDNELVGDAPIVRYLTAGPHFIRITADNYEPFVRRIVVVAGSTSEVAGEMLAGAGTVEFIVQPSGARLKLNGDDPVPTPVRLRDLKPGEYNYKLEAPGHEPETGTFTFAKGKNLLFNVRLKSTAGLVEVLSRPVGARVFVDGESKGVTPLELENVPLGAHNVRLEMPDHATVFRTFDNSDGSKGRVMVELSTAGASLVVDTGSPSGAVSLNGMSIGEGEIVRIPALERGRYELTVKAPDRQPATTTIEVPARGRETWRADLATLDARGGSQLEPYKPLVARWTFWTGAAAGVAAVGAGGYLLAGALTPDSVPTSDTVVVLP